ncbi:DNA/RNA non-specific endonuclease [Polyangium sp. 15x6]|uniref:DNA/RNA non-specific endonuclease n=1 Tax=Polyangium sp. 15x6 TaxID=3042687 RepID=UPI00249A78B3|nr:DNA/RNA non-specific endonuclease [Polyangium sp. 15x6]MDI3288746.1 DNA/RNA non-specific endonuclease [Polyangium sp. 15x6]
MRKKQLEAILADKQLIREISRYTASFQGRKRKTWGAGLESVGIVPESAAEATPFFAKNPVAEKIVLRKGRPALFIQNGTFQVPETDTWRARLLPHRRVLESAIASVGRIELRNHPQAPWVGTGWVIAKNVIVTNRHVAQEFGRKDAEKKFVFKQFMGTPMEARVDFKEEYQRAATLELGISKVLYIAEDGDDTPDVAFLLLEERPGLAVPPPIPLAKAPPRVDQLVAVIGYPALDYYEDRSAMEELFLGIYDVKRLSPGTVSALSSDGKVFAHTCTTLAGNSGSPAVDIETGAVVGIHFGGRSEVANYAVSAPVLEELLRTLDRAPAEIAAPSMSLADLEGRAKDRNKTDYSDRVGYVEDFLGKGHEVPLPTVAQVLEPHIAVIDGTDDFVLRYTNFSVVMNKTRRMPFFTAVNIDGGSRLALPRSRDKWSYDPRLPAEWQTGPSVYANNDLDRGHMVRRLDPVWGADAKKANDDTFHFTNACPQHKDLNQKVWNDLEDYVLDNAGAHELRVCVFTGPVLDAEDPEYRSVQLPRQFWKVVAMVRDDETKELSVTAYMLSQASMITDLEFAYGQFRTYQVSVEEIEQLTGLDFGNLKKHDRFGQEEKAGSRRRLVSDPSDIRF